MGIGANHSRFGKMNLFFFSRRIGCARCVSLGRTGLTVLAVVMFGFVPSGAMYFGYRLGMANRGDPPRVLSSVWQGELKRQQEDIDEAKQVAQENLNALAVRLGKMQAHVIRLDALGQRLTRMAGLDNGEFDFDSDPGQGGPEIPSETKPMDVPDFVSTLDKLNKQLDSRGRQLNVLESLLMNRKVQSEVFPAGRPIKGGWISSEYGMRTDPFNGKQEFHSGMDFADKIGTKVRAVAAGVVTWAGDRYGYGKLVQINHGNGYVTRYGHNEKLLVKVGETVKKGQIISLMGSTGRSTGPHVHLEVILNGHTVNPRKYIQAASR